MVGDTPTGEEAIQLVEQLAPDLVLMDIHLAGTMDGIEAAHAIRKLHGTPVVFLTAFASDETLERAKVTEPFGYIIKPFDERDLRVTIETALHKHRAEKRMRRLYVGEHRLKPAAPQRLRASTSPWARVTWPQKSHLHHCAPPKFGRTIGKRPASEMARITRAWE